MSTTRISSSGATDIDNLAKNTSFSSITSTQAEYGKSATVTDSITITTCTTPTIPVPTIPVKSAVTTCTAPTVPIPDYKIDEFLDRQNQIIAPQFQDEC